MVPPGYNKEATVDISRAMERAARPLWEAESDGPYGKPKIDRFFFVAYSGGAFAGAATQDPKRVKEILPVLTKPIRSQPGARAFAQQASLFGRSVGGARVIKLEITSAITPPAPAIGTVIIITSGRINDLIKTVSNKKITNKAIITLFFIATQVRSSSLAAPDKFIETPSCISFEIGLTTKFWSFNTASSKDILSWGLS